MFHIHTWKSAGTDFILYDCDLVLVSVNALDSEMSAPRVDYCHFALKEQTRYWQDLRAKPSLFPFLMTSDTVITFTTLASNRSFLEKQTQESSYGKF